MNEQRDAEWSAGEWHGKMLIDCDGGKIGKLQDVHHHYELNYTPPDIESGPRLGRR